MKITHTILSILTLGFYSFSQSNSIPNSLGNCIESEIQLKTEVQEKSKKILFFKTPVIKVKATDRIIDSNTNTILQRTTRSIKSEDTWRFKIFNRLKIEENKIVEYHLHKNAEYGKVTTYNKCGEKIEEKAMKSDLILNTFTTK